MEAIFRPSAVYDISSPEFVANPYPVFRQLLRDAPIHYCPERKFYHVVKYSHVVSLFRDPRASSERVKPMIGRLPTPVQQAMQPLIGSLSRWLLFLDPPKHTPLRKVVNQALTSRVINDLEPRIQFYTDALLEAARDKAEIDIIQDLAYPLPAMIIAEMLGAPPSDHEKFKQWSDDISRFLGDRSTAQIVVQAQKSVMEMSDYFHGLILESQQHSHHNLLGQLLQFQRQEPEFTHEDLVANCIALLFAGHETTTNLIGNGLMSLLKHPEQLSLLRQQPELLESAIEECLRFESPVQRMGRIMLEDIPLDDQVLKKGERVLLLMGAANRDPAQFNHPDTFDIRRQMNRHLSFGHGLHMCSGAALGRLEAKIAMAGFLKWADNAQLIESSVHWQFNLGLRALAQCKVRLRE